MQLKLKEMIRIIVLMALTALIALSCESDREVKTPSGYVLDFHNKVAGEKPNEKQYIYYRYKFFVDDELLEAIPDSLPDKKRLVPTNISNISSPMAKIITEALVLMAEGDSASLIIPYSEENSRFTQLKPDQTGRYELKVNHIKDEEAYLVDMEEEHRLEMEKRNKRLERADEVKAELQDYITQYNSGQLKGQLKRVASGVELYTIENGEGDQPVTGQSVAVEYYGCLMDGTAFDSSIPRGMPYVFVVDKQKVIPGWDQALLNMKEGQRVIAFLSSDMSYGQRGAPPTIPPNAPLAFYIDFKNIEK